MNVLQLVQAVAAEIEAIDWGVNLFVSAGVRHRKKLIEIEAVQVLVAPGKLTLGTTARNQTQKDYEVEIAVQKKLDTDETEEAESLVELTELIASYWPLRRPQAMPETICIGAEIDPMISMEHLEEMRLFIGVVTLTFRYCDSSG